jgi:hypothetical protein
MNGQNIKEIGDCDKISDSCENVTELDLSNNLINSWDEVF